MFPEPSGRSTTMLEYACSADVITHPDLICNTPSLQNALLAVAIWLLRNLHLHEDQGVFFTVRA